MIKTDFSGATIELFHPVHLAEMETAALEVLRSGQIASGPKVADLEQAFSDVSGREYILATNDMTGAIMMALYIEGVGEGDEIATVAFSCLRSNSPIVRLGARPLWIDIDPSTVSMSVEDLKSKLNPSVKAVMVYHIAGYPSDIRRISALCNERGIPLIEDCNNAIGATIGGCSVGEIGEYAVFSMYPNRQINGIEGGMLATPNGEIAARAKRLRRFGIDALSFRDTTGKISTHSDVPEIGWSLTMSNLNAAVALSQLKTLPNRVERTRFVADKLTRALCNLRRLRLVRPLTGTNSAFWGFLVLSEHRDELLLHLDAHGIKSSTIHHRNDWYTGFGTPRANLPGTDVVMDQILALPCGYWMTDTQINELICRVSEFDAL